MSPKSDTDWLTYVNLSDSYERRARFLPALLSTVPLLPLAADIGLPLFDWLKVVLGGVGLGAVLAVGLSHLASACGNRFQEKLWPDWPHDSPTNRWLHPADTSVSMQQKQLWYKAIKDLTDLDLQSTIASGDSDELKVVINDAVKALRDRLWTAPEADRVRLHNIEYGFARNLAGLQIVWATFATASFTVCWATYVWLNGSLVWAIASSLTALVTIIVASVLPAYVRKKAHYYAESFFGAVTKSGENH